MVIFGSVGAELMDEITPKQIFPEETLNTILDSGQVDAIAAYKHKDISRGLQYMSLPPAINLGNLDFADFLQKGFIHFFK
jgi:molybdate/tungstate transport system substrate-binding protein